MMTYYYLYMYVCIQNDNCYNYCYNQDDVYSAIIYDEAIRRMQKAAYRSDFRV